jgi:hypothetical protein
MSSEPRTYVVETDAIYGGGVQLKRGDVATEEQLGQYVESLLEAGAIRPMSYDHARDNVSLH